MTTKRAADDVSLAAMGRLTAGLAHEIRNPLNAAMLQLDMLERDLRRLDGDRGEKVARRALLVRTELGRLSALLDDFLHLAQPSTLEPEAFDLAALLRELCEFHAPALEVRGIVLAMQIEPRVRDFVGERHRIRQVVQNLLSNAVEAVEDRVEPRVELEARTFEREDRSSWVEIAVIDNGPGVASEVEDRAFESFVTTKPAGTGLGLTLVQQIVTAHGGEAVLMAVPEGGTRAAIYLPINSDRTYSKSV